MTARQMEDIQRKLAMLNYPRANAPAQSLLFAGMERYALLEWLFFRSLNFLFPLLDLSFVDPPLIAANSESNQLQAIR